MNAARIKMRDALAALRWKNLSPEDVAEVVADTIAEQVKPLRERIAALEAADARRSHKGTYDATAKYEKGNYCAHGGSTWVAMETPCGSPPGNGWVLTAKRGRNARD